MEIGLWRWRQCVYGFDGNSFYGFDVGIDVDVDVNGFYGVDIDSNGLDGVVVIKNITLPTDN